MQGRPWLAGRSWCNCKTHVFGCAGVKRPPIAYYNAATGGVVVTPPKSLFTSFSKSLDKVMQVRAPFCVTHRTLKAGLTCYTRRHLTHHKAGQRGTADLRMLRDRT